MPVGSIVRLRTTFGPILNTKRHIIQYVLRLFKGNAMYYVKHNTGLFLCEWLFRQLDGRQYEEMNPDSYWNWTFDVDLLYYSFT